MSSKTCCKCGKTKAICEFYKHSQMADGHLNKCKDCTKSEAATNYKKTRCKRSEYDQQRQTRPERRLAKLAYQRKYRALNRDKVRARDAVRNAIRTGRLEKRPCEVCGTPRSQAHHCDYSRPLDVIWLCFKHHREDAHHQTVTVAQ